MDYTKNYHLPQWKETDRVMMNDFNQMCLDIESGIDSAKAEAKTNNQALSERVTAAQRTADAAQTSAGNAQTAADKAQTTANNAQAAANTAQTAAGNAQTTADKAQVNARNAQTIASEAQLAANNAHAAADAAQSTATNALEKANSAYSPDQKPYVVGSYVGTGDFMRIRTGFRPSFLIISGQTIEKTSPEVLLATGDVDNGLIGFHIDYFTVYPAVGYYPNIVLKDRTYHYIAFR